MNKPRVVKYLRYRYLVGLSVIALLVTASFITMQRVVSEQKGFSSLINLAGHQAGLSNRIGYFSLLMATTSEESEFDMAKSQIGLTLSKIINAHEIIRNGSIEKGIPFVSNDHLKTIYEDPSLGLDRALDNFIYQAGIVYESEFQKLHIGSVPVIYLTTYGPHALEPIFEAAVDQYEKIGREAILRIEYFEIAVWVLALVTLALELGFIFRPLEKSVITHLNSKEKTILKLNSTRQRLLFAQKLAQVGDWEFNISNRTLLWSDQIYEICGVSPKEFDLNLSRAFNFIHPEDRLLVKRTLRSLVASNNPTEMEFRVVTPQGEQRLVYQYCKSKQDPNGKIISISATIQDITERKELTSKLEKLSEHIPGFIFQFYQDKTGRSFLPYASRGIRETCGIFAEQVKKCSKPFFDIFHPEDLINVKKNILASSQNLHSWHDQFRVCHPQKGYVWLECHATPESLPTGETLWYGYIMDITGRKKRENQIRKLALYDPLTGLANRRLLQDRLAHALSSAKTSQNFGAIIMLDLDNFKSLNDTKGHDVGDALLVEVANRLTSCVRETDTISRLGGDEFVVIVENLGKTKDKAKTKATDIAENIRVALNRTYVLCENQHIHHASSSIGVALFRNNVQNESELLKRADVAMYEAKDLGRNRLCLYSERRQTVINERSALAHDLKLALDNDEFSLLLQPLIYKTGKVCGAEALLRWNPPGKPPISPALFIPVAELTGLILPIGDWVLTKACEYLKELLKKPLPPDFSLAVNISAKQFNDDNFLSNVKKIIDKSAIPPEKLCFELTESCLGQGLDQCKTTILELNNMGIQIELDDFGTGYSSLTTLNKLPLSTLKIDKSLVETIEGKNRNIAILKAAIAMAKAMSLSIVAEGVETHRQSDFLVKEGCDILQGYLFAKPMPFTEFQSFIASRSVSVSSSIFKGDSEPLLKPALTF